MAAILEQMFQYYHAPRLSEKSTSAAAVHEPRQGRSGVAGQADIGGPRPSAGRSTSPSKAARTCPTEPTAADIYDQRWRSTSAGKDAPKLADKPTGSELYQYRRQCR